MDRYARLKQYALIAGFIVAVLLIGFALYWVFFRSDNQMLPGSNTNNTNGGLPNVNDILGNVNVPNGNVSNLNGGAGGNANTPTNNVAVGGQTTAQVLTPEAQVRSVASPTPNQNGSTRYYDARDGKFYRVDSNGRISAIGTGQFPNVQTVTWSPVTDEVILEFPDSTNVYYDLGSNRQVTLPKEFESFGFSPDAKQISFKYMHNDPERRVLAVSSPDGTNARTLESLGENAGRVQVAWSPTGKVAATYGEFIDANRQEIGFIGLNNENFKGAVVEGRGFQYTYAKNGASMIYSTYSASNEYKPRLHIVDADGESIGNNNRDLGLNTFADKCTFNAESTIAYCGVPSQQQFGFGLDRRAVDAVPDDIYKIDLQTGLQTRIATPVDEQGQPVYTVAENSIVVTGDNALMFQDMRTSRLVKIQLQ